MMEIRHMGNGRPFLIGYVHTIFKRFVQELRGVPIDSKNADVIFYSMYDPLDVVALREVRKKNKNALIVAGGIEGFSPGYMLPYADYVCAGEAYNFLKTFPTDSAAGLREWLRDKPNFSSADQVGKTLVPDYEIPWTELPRGQVGKNVSYYLISRGCQNKCAFCAASWLNPHVLHPSPDVSEFKRLAKQKGIDKKAVYLIGNDTGEFPTPYWSKAAASISVKRFLEAPERYRKRFLLHIGIEAPTEARRKIYGKPISSYEINTLMHVTKNLKINIVLFFIVQEPFDMEEFRDAIPVDTEAYPRVTIKFTQVSPTPWTPLEAYDLDKEKPFNAHYWLDYLSAKNRRFRTFPVLALEKEHTKVLLRRAMPGQTEKILELRKLWGDYDKWKSAVLSDTELARLYHGDFQKAFGLVHPYKGWEKAKEKVMEKFACGV
jgi:radical SAM superfamily enzyme YgiQ (UPF0313 family)